MASIAADFRTARLSVADRAMLTYVEKLTVHPATICAGDVQALRDLGFSDSAILDVCQVAAYYAFVNRIAQGLGVELEPSCQG